MSKSKFAGVLIAISLFGAGAANAAQSAFPASPNEATPFSFPYEGMQNNRTGATGPVFPFSVSDAGPFSIPTQERMGTADRLSRTYGSVFPSSPNETGRM